MATRDRSVEFTGMLPKNDERPPWFAFTISLYKSDLLVRSLIDLSVAGAVMLAFAGALPSVCQPAKSAMQTLTAPLHQPTNQLRTGASTPLTTPATAAGPVTK